MISSPYSPSKMVAFTLLLDLRPFMHSQLPHCCYQISSGLTPLHSWNRSSTLGWRIVLRVTRFPRLNKCNACGSTSISARWAHTPAAWSLKLTPVMHISISISWRRNCNHAGAGRQLCFNTTEDSNIITSAPNRQVLCGLSKSRQYYPGPTL